MKKNMQLLNNEFKKIKSIGWIKSKRPGPTGIGYTFERLLEKEEDSLPIWDFYGIEIKTKRRSSDYNIHLFTATPDGDYLYPIERLLEKIGYPDKVFNKKILYTSVNAIDYTKIGYYKKLKLSVDYSQRRVYLIGINNNGKSLQLNVSWSFDMIERILENKLNYLAIVTADTCNIRGKEYFLYNDICFYKFKGFNTFINNIEQGTIKVTFKIGIFKSGKRVGQTHDRGTDFSLKIENIENIYERLDLDKIDSF